MIKQFIQKISTGYSSEIYNVEVDDILNLEDYTDPKVKAKSAISVLITDDGDKLLSGRDIVEQAVKNKQSHVPVQFVFKMKYPAYKLHITLIKKLRDPKTIFGSNIYHINPQDIRDMDIERAFRTLENTNQYIPTVQEYKKLENSILENGYDDTWPMDIRLCRSFGVQDTLNQGHHRMGILIEHNITRASFKFSAVGYIGIPLLRCILLKVSKQKLKQKHK
jgi:hypothetical protein